MFEGEHLNPYYTFKIIVRIAHMLPMFKLEVSTIDITVST